MIDKLHSDLKQALITKDSVRALVIRSILSEIKNREIELRAQSKQLSENDFLNVLLKEAKKRRESIEMFKLGKREDLVNSETAELKIIEEYLPKQINKEDVEKVVKEIVSANPSYDFGLVMRNVMARLKGQADGKMVSEIVKGILSA